MYHGRLESVMISGHPYIQCLFDCVCHIRDSDRHIRADLDGHPQRPLSGNATPALIIDQNVNL
jgi:hypothetical protein